MGSGRHSEGGSSAREGGALGHEGGAVSHEVGRNHEKDHEPARFIIHNLVKSPIKVLLDYILFTWLVVLPFVYSVVRNWLMNFVLYLWYLFWRHVNNLYLWGPGPTLF